MSVFSILYQLYKKEMTCLYRDKEILVYGVVLPLFLIPVVMLIVIEGGLCLMGMSETVKTRVAVLGDSDSKKYVERLLAEKEKTLLVVQDVTPYDELRDGRLDAVVETSNHKLNLMMVEQRDPVGLIKSGLNRTLGEIADESLSDSLKKANLPAWIAQPFRVTTKFSNGTSFGATRENFSSTFMRLAFAGLLASVFLETIITASYSMIIPLISELEQNTWLSTLLIPTHHIVLSISKFLAGLTAAWVSAFEFSVSLVITTCLFTGILALQLHNFGQINGITSKSSAPSQSQPDSLSKRAPHSQIASQASAGSESSSPTSPSTSSKSSSPTSPSTSSESSSPTSPSTSSESSSPTSPSTSSESSSPTSTSTGSESSSPTSTSTGSLSSSPTSTSIGSESSSPTSPSTSLASNASTPTSTSSRSPSPNNSGSSKEESPSQTKNAQQHGSAQTHQPRNIPKFQLPSLDFIPLGIVFFALALAVQCGFIFVIAAWARTSAQAQVLMSVPSMLLSFLPLPALLPNMESIQGLWFLPITNLFLLIKCANVPMLTVAGVITESLAIIAVCIVTASYISMIRSKLSSGVLIKKASGT